MQQNTIGALGWLCYYSRVLHEPLGSCAGTAEQYRSTREAVLVQQSTIGAPGRLIRNSLANSASQISDVIRWIS